MATVDYVVFEHHLKKDGTFNVKFRLTHKGKQVYKASPFHVNRSQIRKNFTIKDYKVLDSINSELASIRARINEIGSLADSYVAKDLLVILTEKKVTYIDFISYGDSYIDGMYEQGRVNSAQPYGSIFRSFKIFIGKNEFDVLKLNSSILSEYEKFLIKGWSYTSQGKVYKTKGLTRSGVNNYMNVIKAIFNSCRKNYNTEIKVLIPNNPFDFYTIPKKQQPRKRGNDLSVEDILKYKDAELKSNKAFSRDMFMISFYLCGMNAIDIWKQEWSVNNGRIEYERSKTREKRSDNSFISIKVPDQALGLLGIYNRAYLRNKFKNYSSFKNFIPSHMPDNFTFYHARHTFATWAYNKCGFSKDHVAMALNHSSNRITDSYIAPDWSIIDRVQEGVLSLLTVQ